MAKLPAFDPIEFLLDRKFGKPGAFAGRPITISAERRRSEEPELAEEIDSHEAYLRKLSPENLSRLVAAEQKKQVQERAAEAEAEERARFFNQPYARADFVHWSKTAHWSSARSLFRLDLAGYCPNKADELTGDRRDDDGRLLLACQHPTVSSAQPHLRLPGKGGMRQSPVIRRCRGMIALDDLGALASLLLQLERGLEEVDVQPSGRKQASQSSRRFNALEAAVAHQASDDRSVLLLNESCIGCVALPSPRAAALAQASLLDRANLLARFPRSRFGRLASSSSTVGIATMLQWRFSPQPAEKGAHLADVLPLEGGGGTGWLKSPRRNKKQGDKILDWALAPQSAPLICHATQKLHGGAHNDNTSSILCSE
jgi:hypothetical protein